MREHVCWVDVGAGGGIADCMHESHDPCCGLLSLWCCVLPLPPQQMCCHVGLLLLLLAKQGDMRQMLPPICCAAARTLLQHVGEAFAAC